MDSCTGTIGKAGYESSAKKDLNKINEQKNRTDEAMDRLKKLYEEYIEQIY